MASAAEQLASSINFGALSKATELKQRIWYTLGILIVARIGTYIPLPGIDPVAFQALFEQHSGGVLGMVDMFAGGAISRTAPSIAGFGVTPARTIISRPSTSGATMWTSASGATGGRSIRTRSKRDRSAS